MNAVKRYSVVHVVQLPESSNLIRTMSISQRMTHCHVAILRCTTTCQTLSSMDKIFSLSIENSLMIRPQRFVLFLIAFPNIDNQAGLHPET
jgi:hypothetical protein